MPCKSDYLAQNSRERELQETAKLLLFVCERVGVEPEPWVKECAENYYANDDRVVPLLCAAIKRLSTAEREKIVFDGHDQTSRLLADWWERHQAADNSRRRVEVAARRG